MTCLASLLALALCLGLLPTAAWAAGDGDSSNVDMGSLTITDTDEVEPYSEDENLYLPGTVREIELNGTMPSEEFLAYLPDEILLDDKYVTVSLWKYTGNSSDVKDTIYRGQDYPFEATVNGEKIEYTLRAKQTMVEITVPKKWQLRCRSNWRTIRKRKMTAGERKNCAAKQKSLLKNVNCLITLCRSSGYVQRATKEFGSHESIKRGTKNHMTKIRKALEREK